MGVFYDMTEKIHSAPRLRAFCWLASVLFLFSAAPLYGSQPQILRTGDLTVLYDAPLKAAASEAARRYPGVRKHLEDIVGWSVDFTPTLLLIKDHQRFQKIAGNPAIMAFALPGKNLMVVDHARTGMDPFGLENTMTHELCHLLLHHHIQSSNLPRWLDEGVAQWVSGGMTEMVDRPRRSLLHRAVLGRGRVSMRDLSGGFPGDGESLFLAYEMSRSFVDYIIQEFGVAGLLEILKRLEQGQPWEEAFQDALAVPFYELEARWRDHLKTQMTWLTYVSYHLYEILFAAGAFLLIYGSIRVFLKKRRYMRETEDDPGDL